MFGTLSLTTICIFALETVTHSQIASSPFLRDDNKIPNFTPPQIEEKDNRSNSSLSTTGESDANDVSMAANMRILGWYESSFNLTYYTNLIHFVFLGISVATSTFIKDPFDPRGIWFTESSVAEHRKFRCSNQKKS